MLASVLGDSNPTAVASAQETQQQQQASSSIKTEIESAQCECCGLVEECTPAYIDGIRERFQGRWICGLCAEAVKDEIARSASERLISTEEALNRHITFSRSGGAPPSDPTAHLISAVRQLLRRSLASPESGLRPPPARKPRRPRTRSDSC